MQTSQDRNSGLCPQRIWNIVRFLIKSMRKSKDVQIFLLAAVALSVTGCRSERRDCVDPQSRILPNSACQASRPISGAHYIYGGASGGHIGDSVIGGGSVSRGGFGSIGGGDAGGE